jgi:hypothetical protein
VRRALELEDEIEYLAEPKLDGAGIELDEQMLMMTAGLRAELKIDDYVSAANTPKLTGLKRILSVFMRPLENFMMRAMQKGIQKAQAREQENAK